MTATAPQMIKGWCPGAYRPMLSGDGWVVRVRPVQGRLSHEQVLGLCRAAEQFGSGVIDLTNRANLQIRGVDQADHEALLRMLSSHALLDDQPDLESRRNILVQPFWRAGDDTDRLGRALLNALPALPDLPAKFGFAVDLGPHPVLHTASADIRLERSGDDIIVRADGASGGRVVTQDTAIATVIEMAHWFAQRHTSETRRMAKTLALHELPADWQTTSPTQFAPAPTVGPTPLGAMIGLPFGQITASDLAQLSKTGLFIRTTPWRMLMLEGQDMPTHSNLITDPSDPLHRIDSCPGAPYCAVATVATRTLARHLARHYPDGLHVSGCAKGCARATAAPTTLVGRDGRFDLVKDGRACDAPVQIGLHPDDLQDMAD